jgi:beta-carotene 3-hydroxylase
MPSAAIINAAILIVTVAAMELVAWAVHRYVMHGFGWGWHRSHHEPRHGHLEKNDLYGVLFGALALLLILAAANHASPIYWIGIGMTAYGFLYFLLHDGLVHRRIPMPRRVGGGYLKRLIQAHRLHHAVRSREGGVSFGFLYAPPVRKLKDQLRRQGEPVAQR